MKDLDPHFTREALRLVLALAEVEAHPRVDERELRLEELQLEARALIVRYREAVDVRSATRHELSSPLERDKELRL